MCSWISVTAVNLISASQLHWEGKTDIRIPQLLPSFSAHAYLCGFLCQVEKYNWKPTSGRKEFGQFWWNLCMGLITDKQFSLSLSLSRVDNLATSLNYTDTIHGKIIAAYYLPIIDENRKHNMQLVRFSCFCEYSSHILMMKPHSQ